MNLTSWVEAIKLLGSKQTKAELSYKIKSCCLEQPPKNRYGEYRIDGEKIWAYIVMQDPSIQKDRIHDALDIESLYHSYLDRAGHRYGKHIYSRYHVKR